MSRAPSSEEARQGSDLGRRPRRRPPPLAVDVPFLGTSFTPSKPAAIAPLSLFNCRAASRGPGERSPHDAYARANASEWARVS